MSTIDRAALIEQAARVAYDSHLPVIAKALFAPLRELHKPKQDPKYSLISWQYCSCGAMEVTREIDGHPSLAPAKYPCAEVRLLDAIEAEVQP